MDPWLILDVSFLAYRSFHALPEFSHEGVRTGVMYGILRDVLMLSDRFVTEQLCFCFDVGRPIRQQIYPNYKRTRRSIKDPAELAARDALHDQIHFLRRELLPSVGFKNIFFQQGYEADDLIASICNHKPKDQRVIVVSSDSDLYQLLSPTVSFWNPRKKLLLTEKSFSDHFGITPTQWIDVKCLAGCKTDQIEGIKGVGEKTALSFLQGTLKPSSVAYNRVTLGLDKAERNRPLIELPYQGTNELHPEPNEINRRKLREVCTSLGIKTLQV